MLIKGAYYYHDLPNREFDIPPKGNSLFVISAGHSKALNLEQVRTIHLYRNDYQLLYVHNGSLHYFDESDTEIIIPAGGFLLYKPQEYQKYDIYKKENTDLYWCHFSGSYAEDFLKSYNLYDKRIITLSPNIQYRRIYSLLRVTLDKREKHFTDLCAVYLQELLLTVSRDMHKASSNQNMPDELKHILNYIEEHYYEDITIDELSKIGLMNKLKLTRYFNEYLKCPPKKYLFNYRINKAKTLLLQTNHKVNEIAFSVGYSNPLYFSTIFRQETGLSPREFREQNK